MLVFAADSSAIHVSVGFSAPLTSVGVFFVFFVFVSAIFSTPLGSCMSCNSSFKIRWGTLFFNFYYWLRAFFKSEICQLKAIDVKIKAP